MRKLVELLAEAGAHMPEGNRAQLHSLLCNLHEAFVLNDGERGETDLVQATIETGDAPDAPDPICSTAGGSATASGYTGTGGHQTVL